MNCLTSLLLALTLALAACNNEADRQRVEAIALRDSLAQLNDLEDRAFAIAQIDGANRFVLVAPVQDLQAVAEEARKATMLGCVATARDGLVAGAGQIIVAQNSGGAAMTEAWKRVEAYRHAAEACEDSIQRAFH